MRAEAVQTKTAASAPLAVSLRGVVKEFRTGGGTFRAVVRLDLDFRLGAFVAGLGPTGAGLTRRRSGCRGGAW